MQLLPGTDFITSGYSATPNLDDIFAGSNTDCDDYDDWYVLQRDIHVDGGIQPARQEEIIQARNKAAKAMQGIFETLGLPEISDEEIEAATYAYSSYDMPSRNIVEDLKAAEKFMETGGSGINVVKALHDSGYHEEAENLLGLLKQRVAGDYLQVAAIIDREGRVRSALNDENSYRGPETGYVISEDRWQELSYRENVMSPRDF
jgi:propanediol dehydratase large subunit